MLWPFKPDKRWIAPILIGAGLLVAGFFIWLRMQPEEVQVYRLVRRDVVATLTVTGEVKARETIAISPMVSARIESVAVDEGDRVLRGQVLVTLDSNDTRASLREAQARVAEAQASVDVLRQGSRQEEIARLQAQVSEIQAQVQRSQAAVAGAQAEQAEAQTYANRLRQLFQTGAVSAQELSEAESRATVTHQQVNQLQADVQASRARTEQLRQQILAGQRGATPAEIRQAQAARQAAQASTEVVRAQLEDRILKSPTDGVVIERLRDPGELGQPGQPILRLVDRDTLEIVAQVEENDLPMVRQGNQALVVLDALPDSSFDALVTKIGNEVNPENGTVDVRLQLTRAAMDRLHKDIEVVNLLPGMTADINIVTARLKQELILPAGAVRKDGGRYYVYRVAGKRIVETPVRVRRISVENYQVLSGLESGVRVAKLADVTLKDKKNVRPVAAVEEAAPEPTALPGIPSR